ncbi:MAG: O-Antigen ligase [bacterium ADurb.Bin400]|nr:MAG: O-Antigen ligase [bacterium ADurb.Bin400]
MALGVTAVLAFYLMTRRVCDCSNVMHRYSWYRWLCGVTQYGFLAGLAIFIMLMVYAIARDPSRLESDMARIEIYRYSWQMVRDNPIWGVGLGNYHTAIEEATRQFPLFRISVLPYALHPHNLVMALWLNLGIAGLAVFAIVVVSYFRRLRQTIDPLRWAGALAMISILVHGVVDTTYFKNDLSALFWLTVALAYVPKAEDASAGQKD